MSLYQAFEVAKIEICDLQFFLGIEISNHLHQCVDHEILPQNKTNKKNSQKRSLYEGDIAI